jgi:hypothetical protein
MRFLEHDECSEECYKYKTNKYVAMAYKTSAIQYCVIHNARKINLADIKG